jgi:hypothetical protein
VRKKRFPAAFGQCELIQLVIATFFAITAFTRNDHIAWDMQSQSKPVHAFKMFNRGSILLQRQATIAATASECSRHSLGIRRIRNAQSE